MIKSATMTEDFLCLKTGDKFIFRPGVNLLVGEQGTGKSALITCLRGCATDLKYPKKKMNLELEDPDTPTQVLSLDFEKDSPRAVNYVEKIEQVAVRFMSHGQCNVGLLKVLEQHEGVIFIMDEPDMALSIRSAHNLVQALWKSAMKGNQIIVAVHNPIIIEAFPEVLSMEHKHTWMTSQDFIASHTPQLTINPEKQTEFLKAIKAKRRPRTYEKK